MKVALIRNMLQRSTMMAKYISQIPVTTVASGQTQFIVSTSNNKNGSKISSSFLIPSNYANPRMNFSMGRKPPKSGKYSSDEDEETDVEYDSEEYEEDSDVEYYSEEYDDSDVEYDSEGYEEQEYSESDDDDGLEGYENIEIIDKQKKFPTFGGNNINRRRREYYELQQETEEGEDGENDEEDEEGEMDENGGEYEFGEYEEEDDEDYYYEEDDDDDNELDEWDEERYGPVDSKDWLGFKGDHDEMTEDGVPIWIQSLRTLQEIHDESESRKSLEKDTKNRSQQQVLKRHQKLDSTGRAYGTGRRKTSSARVWVRPAVNGPYSGRIKVNKMDLVDYFKRDAHREDILAPFLAIDQVGQYDVLATVSGGGLSGQAGAIRHGLSRALENYNPEYRPILKSSGFITRDPRMVERKKPGQKKARKKFQWVKR